MADTTVGMLGRPGAFSSPPAAAIFIFITTTTSSIPTSKPREAEYGCCFRRWNYSKKIKQGMICSIRRTVTDGAGCLRDRVRWSGNYGGCTATRARGMDFPGFSKSKENMFQKANRKKSTIRQVFIKGISGRSVSSEDPWLTKDQNGSLYNPGNQVLDLMESVRPTHDKSSTEQQAARRISKNSDNHRLEEHKKGYCKEDNFACDDNLDVQVEYQGTFARETYLDGDMDNLDIRKIKRTDRAAEQYKRSPLYKRSSLMAKQVVSMSNSRNLGFVSQLWVNLQMLKVEALELKPSLLSWAVDEIFLSNICKIGDVILVENDNVLDRDSTMANCEVLIGSDVLTESNMYLGKVRDYSFNLCNGAIASIEMDSFGVPLIPAKMISTYLVMIDEIIEIASDCLLLCKGAESRILRLTKGFLQDSSIDLHMMQAANSGFTRMRGFRSERNNMVNMKQASRAATYPPTKAAGVLELEGVHKRPKRDSSVAVHIEKAQESPIKISTQSSLSSSQLDTQSMCNIDCRNGYEKPQGSGTTSVSTQSGDELELIPSTESTDCKGDKINHGLLIESQGTEDFRTSHGNSRWLPLSYSTKTKDPC